MTRTKEQTNRRARILVVDDDPETARLLRSWLDESEYEIHDAPDGESGLASAERVSPDLILLDLTMPGIDGLTVARRLNEDVRWRSVPVVLLTACRDINTKVEAFTAGVDDYVTKPFDFEEIAARIRGQLRRREILSGLESTVQELSSSNRQLEQLAMIDEKTGLYNFREFQRRLREEWERSERYAVPLSLVFLDIDHFKQINDTLGHQAGDCILGDFATLVAGGARTNDFAARYGGEEFAVILPHTDGEMAERVAERIRRAVEQFVFLEDEKPTRVTVSSGVATYPATPAVDSVDALIRAADEALYEAKERGRNRVVRRGPKPSAATGEAARSDTAGPEITH
ncbi:MAG: diguanylate cyclase [bacterium]|nr:diguanylate cyclase [bacterium]